MTNNGIDPNIIINIQARQLNKARVNAEGYLKTHRRDQVKIVELQARIDELEKENTDLHAEIDRLLFVRDDANNMILEQRQRIAELITKLDAAYLRIDRVLEGEE